MQACTVIAEFDEVVASCFGHAQDPIELVDQRTLQRFSNPPPIVWEGDAQTFQFSYVSPAAEQLLGYPTHRWVREPTFWADVIIVPEDRDDAIAYCALATTKRRDHLFEYRARRADGSLMWLRDYVRVLVGPRNIANRLRGIMCDVSAEKRASDTFEQPATYRVPSSDVLRTIE